MSNPDRHLTQASSANVVNFPQPRIVSGHKARDKWMVELTKARDTMSPLNYAAGIRLALFFNCTTGLCNPGYPRLSRELGCTLDSAKRACRELDQDGWIKRNQTAGGGHEDKTEFDFLMPYERVSGADTRDAADGCPKQAATGVQKQGGRVSITDSLMNTEGTLKNTEGAPNGAPPTSRVDRVDDHLEQELNPFRESAPYGALDDIDEEFNKRAAACLARNPTWTLNASSSSNGGVP